MKFVLPILTVILLTFSLVHSQEEAMVNDEDLGQNKEQYISDE